ncbi:MAG TPA: hypothetical protein VGI39_35295 [Polyangiaceae bacterium]|jgi:hypothetical protein
MSTSTKIAIKKTTSRRHPAPAEGAASTASIEPASITHEDPMTTTTATKTAQSPISSAPAPGASNVGLAALVAKLSAELDAAEAELGPAAPAVTSNDKKRRGKPRKGSDKVLTQLAPVVVQYGLNSSTLNTADMLAQYQYAQLLAPLQARLKKMSKRVDDEVFNAQTASWEMGLQFYALLRRRGRTNGSIAKSVEPLAKVFEYRHPSTKDGKPSKTAVRAKSQLQRSIELAQKHGVRVQVGPNGEVQGIDGPAASVAAAQAELNGPGQAEAPPATPPGTQAPVLQAPVTNGSGAAGAPSANGH